MLKFSEIPQITTGELLNFHQEQVIENLLIDSRQRTTPDATLFFAIKGPRHDGHLFLSDMYHSGIRFFVVEQQYDLDLQAFPEASFAVVPDSVRALQDIAQYHRKQLSDVPVLAITGSNAKTIIKEWLYQLLADRKVIKSPKSYNSQVGVPLSVWQLNKHAQLGIFEAGISQVDEMEALEAIIQPQLGIFTNIGTAHDAGFANTLQKAQQKALLFKNCQQVIYCRDHQTIHQVLTQQIDPSKLISWSTEQEANVSFTLEKGAASYLVKWSFESQNGELSTSFSDPASLENLCHCIVFMITLGYSPPQIASYSQDLKSVEHRLALKKGVNNCYLIDDTYNNDVAGLEIALDFLNQQPHAKETTLILSDVQQASESSSGLYSQIAELIKVKKVQHFYGIGSGLSQQKELFPSSSQFYETTEQFLTEDLNFQNQTILIKGARAFRFERIVESLEEKIHGTVLEIDLDALVYNLNKYKSKLPASTKVMVMVKAFAYGSGSNEIAHMLQYQGVDYLGVAYADEGIALRKDGIQLPIMVMNPSPEGFGKLIQYNLEPELYNLSLLEKWLSYPHARTTPIHLKLDTGMHRLGFEENQIDRLTQILKKEPLPVASIFSHLAVSENMHQSDFTHLQAERFKGMARSIQEALGVKAPWHLLNSSGILNYPEYHFDMVRLGVGLYGVGAPELRAISTLKTTISQIKKVDHGDTVGYGRQGVVHKPTTIATIAIGYADGFDRRNGNGVGRVNLHGTMVPVIGNVCMDMTMIDVTEVPQAQEGDVVTIFDKNYTIADLANTVGTIPYEVLTHISPRVKRVYFAQ